MVRDGKAFVGLAATCAIWVATGVSTARAQASVEEALTPPRLLEAPPNVYPTAGDGRTVRVELLITVQVDGSVGAPEVQRKEPANAEVTFDEAAVAAARLLKFEPASRGGTPIAARIRYEVTFEPPTIRPTSEPVLPPKVVPKAVPKALPAARVPPNETTKRTSGTEITIRTRKQPESRGSSDFYSVVGGLRYVPRRANASDLLRLAPGILLTNEGGDGHADTIYLRGFDAHEGQDLEFTVNGVPVNEPGHPHGEGLANLTFIIPELVRSVRVIEGPFDPHQGNYAVAGSAHYDLGLEQKGLTLQYQLGSFNTHRLLATWAPEDSEKNTFAGVDIRSTDGFGRNRAARHARAMGQYETKLGNGTTLQVLATSYGTKYGSAGVVRQDDYQAGRVDFFGTYDATQGGDASRNSASVSLSDATDERELRQQLFATLRDSRSRFNYTGFVEDPPAPYRSGLSQRGDETDQAYGGITVGARGSLRLRETWRKLAQALEAGYYARHDSVDSSQKRLRFGTVTPYRTDFDYHHSISNLGLYLDAEVRPLSLLTLRGGVRGDFFNYDSLSRCDLHDTFISSSVSVQDTLCYDRDRTGPRDPSARRSSSGLALQPRAAVLFGPIRNVTLTASVGRGVRAADPSYLADGDLAPFVSILATEGGALFHRQFGRVSVNARALYYYTFVGRDLIFNQQEGRNTLAPGTRRQGFIAAGRVTGPHFDSSLSATYAHARFDRREEDPGTTYFPPDAGNTVPYVPTWVVRSDTALFAPLPFKVVGESPLLGRAGLGVTYVSPRALPYGERADTMFVVDVFAGARFKQFELGLALQNVFDLRYRLAEYNYVSEFEPNSTAPNMLPARHFSAGPPRSLLLTFAIHTGPAPKEGK